MTTVLGRFRQMLVLYSYLVVLFQQSWCAANLRMVIEICVLWFVHSMNFILFLGFHMRKNKKLSCLNDWRIFMCRRDVLIIHSFIVTEVLYRKEIPWRKSGNKEFLKLTFSPWLLFSGMVGNFLKLLFDYSTISCWGWHLPENN